ncbi:hypothetical protein K9B35_16530 [Sphingomonas sp. R647]|uniref:hypothetical protein n=1 Tax=Sphingomonas sp. R647 TaxID=2875233 RepID=UPI001CD1C950|nr:hypothetical protein [Sphingomonas sp. R647]MCA1199576.1 hypothetical protein [Sphingomonas sp. R647]
MPRPLMISAAALLALTACGGGDGGNVSAGSKAEADSAKTPGTGQPGGIGVTIGDLPDFVELPPGAKPIHNLRMKSDGKAGGTLTLETNRTADDLVAFYRASMDKHGLKIGMENMSDHMTQLLAESEDKSKTLMVMVTKDDEGKLSLNLTHSRTIS